MTGSKRRKREEAEIQKRDREYFKKYREQNKQKLKDKRRPISEHLITDKRMNGQGWINHYGYRMIGIKTKNGYCSLQEHRYIMEQALGRKLLREEHIHHKNGNILDNRIENLELINIKAHGSLEGKKAKGIPKPSLHKEPPRKKCLFCGKEFIVLDSQFKRKFCSISCNSKNTNQKVKQRKIEEKKGFAQGSTQSKNSKNKDT